MKTLKINLLYRCTAKCSHCRFFCENESEVVTPDFETPYAVAKGLKENFGLDMAVILGGEPTLFRDETIQLIQRIHALGVRTRLETNAWWAESYEKALDLVSAIKETKTDVMLSLDAFHEPFVPARYVANAVKACIDAGIRYNLEVPYLDPVHKEHALDKRTESLVNQLCAEFDTEIPQYEGGILFIGRAADEFGDLFAQNRGVPTEPCTKVPWWGDSDIETLDLLILEPGGYITKGCGIAIGNVHDQDLKEMLVQYNAQNHPIFKILLTEGPLGLAKLAEQYGYKIKDQYADKCHLCQEARRILKPYYDDILKPDQHYTTHCH